MNGYASADALRQRHNHMHLQTRIWMGMDERDIHEHSTRTHAHTHTYTHVDMYINGYRQTHTWTQHLWHSYSFSSDHGLSLATTTSSQHSPLMPILAAAVVVLWNLLFVCCIPSPPQEYEPAYMQWRQVTETEYIASHNVGHKRDAKHESKHTPPLNIQFPRHKRTHTLTETRIWMVMNRQTR